VQRYSFKVAFWGVAAGASVAASAFIREYSRIMAYVTAHPEQGRAVLHDFRAEWAAVLLGSILVSLLVPFVAHLASQGHGCAGPLFAFLVPALLLISCGSVYVVVYHGVFPGLHINVPAIMRYTPAVAGLAALGVHVLLRYRARRALHGGSTL
jgi:hypothetical protein